MQCWACGKDNMADEVFCLDCGFPQYQGTPDHVATNIRCSVCNQVNDTDSSFCYHCGNYLPLALEAKNCSDVKLILRDGRDIPLNGVSMFIDRSFFNGILTEDDLKLISRNHARITLDHEHYFVEDFGSRGTGSTNGTKLNDIAITGGVRQLLIDGDRIKLADLEAATLIFKQKGVPTG